MDVFVWISQAVLVFVFGASGITKLVRTRDELLQKTPYVEDFSQVEVQGIGILEILGALGVVAPVATGIFTRLTPIAAAGLGLLMMGATLTHMRRGEFKYLPMNGLLFFLTVVVAVARVRPVLSQMTWAEMCLQVRFTDRRGRSLFRRMRRRTERLRRS